MINITINTLYLTDTNDPARINEEVSPVKASNEYVSTYRENFTLNWTQSTYIHARTDFLH